MGYVVLFVVWCIFVTAYIVWYVASQPRRAAKAAEAELQNQKYKRYRRKQPGDFTIRIVKESEFGQFACGPLEIFESPDDAFRGAGELVSKWKAGGDSVQYTHVEIYRFEPCPTCEHMRHVLVEKRQLV
jgi:hypothetical protein